MENSNTMTLGNFYNNLNSQTENPGQTNLDSPWAYGVVDFMATKHLTLRFGDFSLVNQATTVKTYQAVTALLFICAPLIGSYPASQGNFISYLRVWDMLITHLTFRFGDLSNLSQEDLVKACKAILNTERTSSKIIQNVIQIASRRGFQAQGSSQIGKEEAA